MAYGDLDKCMDAAVEIRRNPVSRHQIQPEYRKEQADGTGRLNPSRETKFSGTHGDRGMFIFPVQLTTSRIGNLTRLIHTLLYVMTIHTYINVPRPDCRVFLFCFVLTFSVLIANAKKLLYTVANPARGLLNREKRI